MISLRDQAILTANAIKQMIQQGMPDGCQTALWEHADDLMRAVSLEPLPVAAGSHQPFQIGHFDICKEMAKENLNIQISPLDNITDLKKVRAGTNITIGVAGNLVAAIGLEKKYIGGLLLCDRDQYFATKKRLESEQGERLRPAAGKPADG